VPRSRDLGMSYGQACARIHTHTRTQTQTNKHTHTHTHTHIHTHTRCLTLTRNPPQHTLQHLTSITPASSLRCSLAFWQHSKRDCEYTPTRDTHARCEQHAGRERPMRQTAAENLPFRGSIHDSIQPETAVTCPERTSFS
jgi:hypothetical protein